MKGRKRYTILYAREVYRHVDSIDRKYHRLIRTTIEEQLSDTPERRTRNRKPLEEIPGPFGSTWELRFGPDNRFRVFYEVGRKERSVWILAIGVKVKSRLLVAGEELSE